MADAKSRMAELMASDVFKTIKKKFGASALTVASEVKLKQVPRLSSGIFQLDYALAGGWPVGRVNEVYGMKSTSKTTLMCLAIAEAQKVCGKCYRPLNPCECGDNRVMSVTYIDAEGTYDGEWASKLGVDLGGMILAQPDHAEQSLDIAEALIRSKVCDIIVIDSLAFLTPLAEIAKSTSEESPGAQSRVIGKAVRKFVAALNHVSSEEEGWKPTIFAINQIRMKIGVMFGSPETLPGGLAVGFATSTEVKVNNGKYAMDDDTGRPLHVDIPFRVEKNKCGVPKMEGNYRLILSDTDHKHAGQVYDEDFVLKMAEKVGLVSGGNSSWDVLGRHFNGKKLIELAMLEEPEFNREIRAALKSVLMSIT